jgi:hypothetical protein
METKNLNAWMHGRPQELRYIDVLNELRGNIDTVLADMRALAAKRLRLGTQGWWMQVDGAKKVPISKAIGERNRVKRRQARHEAEAAQNLSTAAATSDDAPPRPERTLLATIEAAVELAMAQRTAAPFDLHDDGTGEPVSVAGGRLKTEDGRVKFQLGCRGPKETELETEVNIVIPGYKRGGGDIRNNDDADTFIRTAEGYVTAETGISCAPRR